MKIHHNNQNFILHCNQLFCIQIISKYYILKWTKKSVINYKEINNSIKIKYNNSLNKTWHKTALHPSFSKFLKRNCQQFLQGIKTRLDMWHILPVIAQCNIGILMQHTSTWKLESSKCSNALSLEAKPTSAIFFVNLILAKVDIEII